MIFIDLNRIKVDIVSEDPETYDVHANIIGGWPTLVSPIIQCTRSLNYDPDKLPDDLKNTVQPLLAKFSKYLLEASKKPDSHSLGRAGVLSKPEGSNAAYITYGFKAPIAITLAPWFAHVMPHFKLIQVVRLKIILDKSLYYLQKYYQILRILYTLIFILYHIFLFKIETAEI